MKLNMVYITVHKKSNKRNN